jgi:protein O-mannosyl-transferase
MLVAVAAFVTFLPALDAGFVNWDDDKLFLNNSDYRGLGRANLEWMFKTTKMGHWQPLTWMTFGLDFALWGMQPRGYHLTNMLLHAACAVAFYFLAVRLLALARRLRPGCDSEARADRTHGSRSPRGDRDPCHRGSAGASSSQTDPGSAGALLSPTQHSALSQRSGDPGAPGSTQHFIAAAVAALFFAVHPLRTESVAWVTERRDLLSGLFFILTLTVYVRSRTAERGRAAWYVGALALFVVSVLSKAWGMTIPAVLIVLDVYPLGRLGAGQAPSASGTGGRAASGTPRGPAGASPSPRMTSIGSAGASPSRLSTQHSALSTKRCVHDAPFPPGWLSPAAVWVWLEKMPFVLIAALTAGKAIAAQSGQLATVKSLTEHPLAHRAAQAAYGAAFYAWKTLIPTRLIPLYQLPKELNPWEPRFVVSAAAVVLSVGLLVAVRRRWPAGLALAVAYLAIYSPVSGVAQSGPQLVKDSYSYLCCLSWALLLGGFLGWIGGRWGRRAFAVGALAAVAWVGALAAGSWRQARIWHDSEVLWTHQLAIDERCALAHNNLAILLKQSDRLEAACGHYERSLALDPDDADTHFNYANCLKALRRYDAAVAEYEQAIAVHCRTVARTPQDRARRPEHVEAHRNLGNTLYFLKRLPEAIEHHLVAAEKQRDAVLEGQLESELREAGRSAEAETYFERAVQQRPDDYGAHLALGRLLLERGACPDALTHLRRAVQLKPDSTVAQGFLRRAETACSP